MSFVIYSTVIFVEQTFVRLRAVEVAVRVQRSLA